MLALLTWILDGIELIGSYALWAIESGFNAIGAAMVGVYTATMALLPSMSDAPVLGHPQWLDWLSWFYPVGDLVAGLTAIVTIWVGWLAVRYVLRLIRAT